MRIFISGGCKNGKSFFAQRLALAQRRDKLYYVATMNSTGEEDDRTIARHIEDRAGWGFTTVEQPSSILHILENCDSGGSFLLDALTSLMLNEMFDENWEIIPGAGEKTARELGELISEIGDIVIVSDYIYGDAERYDELTEIFRRNLAMLDMVAAKMCDTVLEVDYANVTVHKGSLDGIELSGNEGAI